MMSAKFDSQTVAYATSATMDMPDRGWRQFKIALTGNMTINAQGKGKDGAIVVFNITDDITGSHVVTFGSNFKSSGTLTCTASKQHTVLFICDGVNWCEIARTSGL